MHFPKKLLKGVLSERAVALARRHFSPILSRVYAGNLHALAAIWRCDKEGLHSYANHYQKHFQSRRHAHLNLLEIGIGGYNHPTKGGASLRMWKYYFPNAQVHGIDIYDKKSLEEHRITIHQGSQEDESFLREVVENMGSLDIVIDDGSHINTHVIKSFEVLFPLLSEGGIYIIEDMQTAYWPSYGGKLSPKDPGYSMVDFLKERIDGLNHLDFLIEGYAPTLFDKNISAMHFYHNLCFIEKSKNREVAHWTEDKEALRTPM
ncbi:MAG: class I SAM-dependent methyltransferase [Thiocapsa sp.]|uniref:class I SAM-dependent methyltransferase n=1 Tax=Thiocapsa sp. TaxID=2024551 RepID=UPI001BCBCF7E|nr:class I SAM-dependent methyltransferase [Thiocapsa sp.]QVL50093.1 MAG: class I SAM-dependent methyltransferase [Thiocapsa sp.]